MRQLERLKRGELPKADRSSVEDIHDGREERMARILGEQREREIAALRKTLHDSIERGGSVTDEQLDAALAEKSAQLTKEGFE